MWINDFWVNQFGRSIAEMEKIHLASVQKDSPASDN